MHVTLETLTIGLAWVLPFFLVAMAGGFPCCCGARPGSTSTEQSSTAATSSALRIVEGCAFCQPHTLAEYYQVEIEGVVEHTDCHDCAELDGVYIFGPMSAV